MTDVTKEGGDDAGGLRLRILATTDLHGHLLPHDDFADRPAPGLGLAQAAALIRRLRAEAPGGASLLLDNGDVFEGSLLSDWIAAGGGGGADRPPGGPHPMIAAMNALGYDAGTLGNHEFSHGLAHLGAILRDAAFPIVSANILTPDGRPLTAASAILEREVPDDGGTRHLLRIGVLGLAPPQFADWDALVLAGGVRTRDILPAAAEEAARLRAGGADLVVALCHSGIAGEVPGPGLENAAIPLAAIPEIDVVVAGHTHRVFPGPGWTATPALDPARGRLHGKPAVQPGCFGSHVGVVDLVLERGPDGWRPAAHRAWAEPVTPGTPLDPAVEAVAAPFHRRLTAMANRPAGRTRVPLHSYFSLVGSDRVLDLLADALRDEAARHLAGTGAAGLPILAAVSPFKAGGRGGPGNYIDIPPGDFTVRQGAELYVHPNTFCLVEITGAGLKDWLERSASVFRTLVPGATDQPLLDPEVPAYNFDVIDGLTWAIDPTRPPRTGPDGTVLDPSASRVLDLRHGGRPVGPRDRFVLATNSFRLGSGGGFAAARTARALVQGTRPIREVLRAHIERTGPIDPAPRPRWRFAPHPGTAAWFDTGPGALAHLAEVADRDIEPLGPAPGGFERFRLRL